MKNNQAPYPGFQPFVAQAAPPYANPEQPFPVQQPPAYPTQQPTGFPMQQPAGYPMQQAAGFPMQQPAGYPIQQPVVFTGPGFVPQPIHPGMFPHDSSGSPKPSDASVLVPEDGRGKDITADWSGFSNKAIRALFVRKVYAILMLQLTFSLAVICLFVFEKHVNLFVQQNMFVYLIAYVVFLAVYIALACCGNLRRQYPTNVIMLSIFTVAMSYMLGVISSFHETRVVLMAVGICAGVCLVISLFSFHTKFDFTTCGGVLFVLCWVLFLFGIITIFTYNDIMNTIYAACGALLFVGFLAYDTQMIMGGRKHEMSPEEHIFGAICLYLDVVYIFMFLLMAFGGKK